MQASFSRLAHVPSSMVRAMHMDGRASRLRREHTQCFLSFEAMSGNFLTARNTSPFQYVEDKCRCAVLLDAHGKAKLFGLRIVRSVDARA